MATELDERGHSGGVGKQTHCGFVHKQSFPFGLFVEEEALVSLDVEGDKLHKPLCYQRIAIIVYMMCSSSFG